MAFTAKVLASGQLPNTQTAIYTVPAATKAYVRFFSIVNGNAAEQTIDIYVKSGTARRVARAVLAQHASDHPLDGEVLMLGAGDSIEAITTTASAVDYVLSGVEET